MERNTIEVRQQNPEETDKMAQFESPNGESVCASYVARQVAESLGEFATLIIGEGDVQANLDKSTTNYEVFDTPGENVTGLYINHDEFDSEEAPESVEIGFAPSDEESFKAELEEIESTSEDEEEEANDLLADSDDEEEELVVSDDDLELEA